MRENLESLRNSDEELYASITNEEQRQKEVAEAVSGGRHRAWAR